MINTSKILYAEFVQQSIINYLRRKYCINTDGSLSVIDYTNAKNVILHVQIIYF